MPAPERTSTFSAPSLTSGAVDPLTAERSRLLDRMILVFAVAGSLASVFLIIRAIIQGFDPVLPLILSSAVICWVFVARPLCMPPGVKAGILCAVLATAGIAGMTMFSFSGTAEISCTASLLVAYLAFGRRIGLILAIFLTAVSFSAHIGFAALGWRADYDANAALRNLWGGLVHPVGFGILTVLLLEQFFASLFVRMRTSFAKVKESEDRFQRVVAATQDGLWEYDYVNDFASWPPLTLRLLHLTEQTAPQCLADFRQLIHPDDLPRFEADMQANINERIPYDLDFRIRCGDGVYRWFRSRGDSIFDERGAPLLASGSIRDIDDRKRIEHALRERDASYRVFVDNSQDGIWCIRYDPPVDLHCTDLVGALKRGRIVECNPAGARIFQHPDIDDILGQTLTTCFTTASEQSNLETLMTRFAADGCTSLALDMQRLTQDGSIRHLRHALHGERRDEHLVRIWAVTSDLTDLREVQAQLNHAQKMDAIGQLAGGIAHDFNNSLAGIMGAADLLQRKVGGDESLQRLVGIIHGATERARDLNAKLLSFGRRSKSISSCVSINDLVADTVTLLERSIDPRITIEHHPCHEPAQTIGDPAEIQSALMNLGVNARDAMPAGGRLCFRTGREVLSPADCQATTDFSLVPGPYIQVMVSDTGSGIDPDVLQNIFEPFYTTKEVGKGTGLGLAAVFGTMQQHQGAVRVDTTLGVGTTFTLLFPAVDDQTATTNVAMTAGRKPTAQPRRQHLLLVDDEDLVRETAKLMLESLGYVVVEAHCGEAALRVLEESRITFDGVLLDYTMPDMTGEQVFDRIRLTHPSLPVVIGSGFITADVIDRMTAKGLAGFLNKPYGVNDLDARFGNLCPPQAD